MQTKAVTALYDYWTEKRGERAVPLRNAIDPAEIAPILPDIFILESARLGAPRFRLAGTRICAQFARELKGTALDALFTPDQRARVSRIAQDVMAGEVSAVLQIVLVDGRLDTTEAEILLLPLATKGRTADRIIGAFSPLPGQPRPLAAFRHATLGAVSAAGSERPPLPAASPPTSVMAIRPSAFGQAMHRVLHLRVFEGGRRPDDA